MKASKSGGTVIKRGKAEKAFTVFNYIFFILLSIVMVYPFWHVIMMSFSSVEATAKGGVFLYPQGFNLDTYAKYLKIRPSGPDTLQQSALPYLEPYLEPCLPQRPHIRFPRQTCRSRKH